MNYTNRDRKVARNSGGGIGFLGLLAIAFIVLKLTGHIDWSWWWVLAPLWLPLLIAFVVLFFVFAVIAIRGVSRWRIR